MVTYRMNESDMKIINSEKKKKMSLATSNYDYDYFITCIFPLMIHGSLTIYPILSEYFFLFQRSEKKIFVKQFHNPWLGIKCKSNFIIIDCLNSIDQYRCNVKRKYSAKWAIDCRTFDWYIRCVYNVHPIQWWLVTLWITCSRD